MFTGRKRQRSRLRKRLSRSAQYVFVRTAVPLVAFLPLAIGRRLAAVAGSFAYALMSRERRIALDNLSFVYGETRSPRELRRLARAVFQHTAVVFVEWLILRRWSREKLARAFPELPAEFRRIGEEYGTAGRGTVGICAHFGNWEVLSLFFGHFAPGTLYSMAKRPRHPPIADFLHRLRSTPGASMVYTDDSPRQLVRLLWEGKIIGFLPDQDIRTNAGVFVEFFGRPAHTVAFPMSLARKTDSRFATCFLVREKSGFRLLVTGPFEVERTDDPDADVLAATQLWTAELERAVRQYPEQWFWHYPRWRSTPAHARRFLGRRNPA